MSNGRGRPKIKYGILSVDPFDVSKRPTLAQVSWANWFKEITQDMPDGTYHIRRIHYRTLGKLKPDGKPYENTTNDSALLARASEYARYLGFVDFDRIEDHKNKGETVQVVYEPDEVETDFDVSSKSLRYRQINELSDLINGDGSSSIEYGISIRNPYHLELWVEKSTVNDILIPIARKHSVTLMVASGQFSITNVKDMYHRIKDLNKPVRIFYLRDFDPAGETMARAVARKIEWFIRTKRPEIDLKLFDVALTHDQCIQYQLPRSPMDRKEQYKGNFEEKYGEGATELDALEATHPGTLTDIVKKAIAPYFDHDLHDRITDFQYQEQERFNQYRSNVIREVIELNRTELEPLVKEYNKLLGRINKIGAQIEELIDSTEIDYGFEPDYPEASSQIVEEEMGAIFDTALSFEEQLEKYREERT